MKKEEPAPQAATPRRVCIWTPCKHRVVEGTEYCRRHQENIRPLLGSQAEAPRPTAPNSQQIQVMVNRFLTWRLPENFNPDGGISFKRTFNENTAHPMKHEPVGTNLLDATQAEAMIRYLIEGVAESRPSAPTERSIEVLADGSIKDLGPAPELKTVIRDATGEAESRPSAEEVCPSCGQIHFCGKLSRPLKID
jgi:hypothetical protein